MRHTSNKEDTGFLLINHLGVEVKIALHSEFTDDNLLYIGEME